jgi:hypothetical protein
MTVVWDDDGDGTVYDHQGTAIGTVSPDQYDFPDDIQSVISETFRKEANLGNSPVMSSYAGELLLQKIDEDIERTSQGATVPQ